MARKIIAYHLLFTFLLCTFQVGITQHICCGKISETKIIFGKGTASCGMEKTKKKNCQSNHLEKNCCHDKSAKFQFLQNFENANDSVELTKISCCLFNFTNSPVFSISFFNRDLLVSRYSPPNIPDPTRSLAALQVFRI